MNAIFDISRFWKLERRNILLSRMHYIYILVGLTGLYLLSMLMKMWTSTGLSGLIYVAIFVTIVAGPCLFEKSKNKHAGIFDFILPASTFEKFLSIWLKYVVIMPVLIYSLMIMLNLITGLIPIAVIHGHADSIAISQIFLNRKMLFVLYGLQAMYLGGYFYFKKYAFAKTSVLIMIVAIFLMCIGGIIPSFFLSGEEITITAGMGDEADPYQFSYNLGYIIATVMEDSLINIMDIVMDVIFVVGMWIVCFFKLRETEI